MANVVEVVLAGTDRLSGPMGTVSRSLAAAGAAIVALGAAATVALRSFATFESSIQRIAGLSNTGTGTLKKWKDEILKLGPALGQTPQALADAMFFISSAGLSSAAAMDVLKASAAASSAGLGDLTSIARTSISALNAYGENNLSASHAVDIMVAAVREGNVETTEFAGSLGRVLPVASKLGVSMEEVSGSIAAMTNIGLDANESVTALRGILNAILGPSEQATQELAKVGGSFELVRAILRGKGEGEGLLGALQLLMDAANGDIEVLGRMFPEIRGLTGAFALLGENADKTHRIFKNMKDATGSTTKALEAQSDTLNFKFNQAWSQFQVTLIRIGEALKPAAIELLNQFTEGLTRLTPDIIRNVQGIVKQVSSLVGIIAKIPKEIIEFGLIAVVIRGKAGLAIGAGAVMFPWFDNFVRKTLGADEAAKQFLETTGQVARTVDNTGRVFIHVANNGIEGFTSVFDEANEEIAEFSARLKPLQENTIITNDAMEDYGDTIGTLASDMEFARRNALDPLTRGFEDLARGIRQGIDGVFSAIGDLEDIAKRFGGDITEAFRSNLGDALFKVFKGETVRIKEVWTSFLDDLLQSFSKMMADIIIKATVEPFIQKAIAPVASFIGGLIPGFAEGGLVKGPTVALVGEAGPELVLPLKLAGEFVKGSIVEAAKTSAFTEAATKAATEAALKAGLEVGVEQGAAQAGAAAAGVAGAATSAALFLFIDAANQGAGTRAIGAALLGRGGHQGLIPKGLGALGLGAFRGGRSDPHAAGLANVESIRRQFGEAAEALGGLPFTAQQLIDFTGGNPFTAREILAEAGAFSGFQQGDAAGRFLTGPSLRLVGEAGPEHVLNVDSEPSVRALQGGLRPIVRGLFEEMGLRGGGGGGGGGGGRMDITININEPRISTDDDISSLADRLAREISSKILTQSVSFSRS